MRVGQVRLIDEDGTQVGIKSIQEALKLAQERGKDLVEIAPLANPPVCKVLDFSKYRYEEDKKARDARKKQKGGHLKEVRVRPRISEHDLEIKLRHAKDFLAEFNKVQVTIVFMGRENQHKDLGYALGEKIKGLLIEYGDLEGRPSSFGNRIIMTFIPKKK
ncbi:MAG: translation initiation factor IF-3 [Elusimicrobia bacterium RIFOXYA1_FULL_47_7]|nr:MAG: translation initiation factor IF-3 [Elusimicrobia bacterium RIFOXYA12_FULL_49_49]OGS06170.1 MAG: translation initiation factor IF-3 [Elusimicrobia bacterium RIFOXYA1_FULL_47_7]OGS11010.1 MAG: translation initiation factor IF-3 [Elusimicrobia bacterium RIFOXYB1_FULL_48_9]OGS15153.1 MAG: translation initiation factor IF-3 [Elusimicrobia bacterium RIFOXYA2_FULL_47_53]OGS29773.1 MAG: translation initiation factor IF-3 [Elusimicrobia bacterium RIFOXYB2_FULL_46_23]